MKEYRIYQILKDADPFYLNNAYTREWVDSCRSDMSDCLVLNSLEEALKELERNWEPIDYPIKNYEIRVTDLDTDTDLDTIYITKRGLLICLQGQC